MKSLNWSTCSLAVISSSLPQVLILVEYFLERALRIAGRARGAYLAGAVAGGGETFPATMTGTVVVLGTKVVEEEEMLGGELVGICSPVTIELYLGKGKPYFLLSKISNGSSSFHLSKYSLYNNSYDVTAPKIYSLYFWVTKAEVSIPLLYRSKTISVNSFSFSDLNKTS